MKNVLRVLNAARTTCCPHMRRWSALEEVSLSAFCLTAALLGVIGSLGGFRWEVALSGAFAGVVVVVGYYFSIAGFAHAQFVAIVVGSLIGIASYHGIDGVNENAKYFVFFATVLNVMSIAALWTRNAKRSE